MWSFNLYPEDFDCKSSGFTTREDAIKYAQETYEETCRLNFDPNEGHLYFKDVVIYELDGDEVIKKEQLCVECYIDTPVSDYEEHGTFGRSI